MAKEKAALITGGATRLGREMALWLCRAGFDIALNYKNSQAEAEEVCALIQKAGQNCLLLYGDLEIQEEVIPLFDRAYQAFPHLSLLINNASIFEKKAFAQTDADFFARNFALHVKAPFFLTQAFAQKGIKGQVINITDTNVLKNQVDYFAYLLSKKTLSEFTKMAAKALAPDLRVNAIAPGPILVPVDRPDLAQDQYMEARAQNLLLKMPGSPAYILEGLAYLLANPFVTGECLFIDGGEHVKN